MPIPLACPCKENRCSICPHLAACHVLYYVAVRRAFHAAANRARPANWHRLQSDREESLAERRKNWIEPSIVGRQIPDFTEPLSELRHVAVELEEIEQSIMAGGAAKDCA